MSTEKSDGLEKKSVSDFGGKDKDQYQEFVGRLRIYKGSEYDNFLLDASQHLAEYGARVLYEKYKSLLGKNDKGSLVERIDLIIKAFHLSGFGSDIEFLFGIYKEFVEFCKTNKFYQSIITNSGWVCEVLNNIENTDKDKADYVRTAISYAEDMIKAPVDISKVITNSYFVEELGIIAKKSHDQLIKKIYSSIEGKSQLNTEELTKVHAFLFMAGKEVFIENLNELVKLTNKSNLSKGTEDITPLDGIILCVLREFIIYSNSLASEGFVSHENRTKIRIGYRDLLRSVDNFSKKWRPFIKIADLEKAVRRFEEFTIKFDIKGDLFCWLAPWVGGLNISYAKKMKQVKENPQQCFDSLFYDSRIKNISQEEKAVGLQEQFLKSIYRALVLLPHKVENNERVWMYPDGGELFSFKLKIEDLIECFWNNIKGNDVRDIAWLTHKEKKAIVGKNFVDDKEEKVKTNFPELVASRFLQEHKFDELKSLFDLDKVRKKVIKNSLLAAREVMVANLHTTDAELKKYFLYFAPLFTSTTNKDNIKKSISNFFNSNKNRFSSDVEFFCDFAFFQLVILDHIVSPGNFLVNNNNIKDFLESFASIVQDFSLNIKEGVTEQIVTEQGVDQQNDMYKTLPAINDFFARVFVKVFPANASVLLSIYDKEFKRILLEAKSNFCDCVINYVGANSYEGSNAVFAKERCCFLLEELDKPIVQEEKNSSEGSNQKLRGRRGKNKHGNNNNKNKPNAHKVKHDPAEQEIRTLINKSLSTTDCSVEELNNLKADIEQLSSSNDEERRGRLASSLRNVKEAIEERQKEEEEAKKEKEENNKQKEQEKVKNKNKNKNKDKKRKDRRKKNEEKINQEEELALQLNGVIAHEKEEEKKLTVESAPVNQKKNGDVSVRSNTNGTYVNNKSNSNVTPATYSSSFNAWTDNTNLAQKLFNKNNGSTSNNVNIDWPLLPSNVTTKVAPVVTSSVKEEQREKNNNEPKNSKKEKQHSDDEQEQEKIEQLIIVSELNVNGENKKGNEEVLESKENAKETNKKSAERTDLGKENKSEEKKADSNTTIIQLPIQKEGIWQKVARIYPIGKLENYFNYVVKLYGYIKKIDDDSVERKDKELYYLIHYMLNFKQANYKRTDGEGYLNDLKLGEQVLMVKRYYGRDYGIEGGEIVFFLDELEKLGKTSIDQQKKIIGGAKDNAKQLVFFLKMAIIQIDMALLACHCFGNNMSANIECHSYGLKCNKGFFSEEKLKNANLLRTNLVMLLSEAVEFIEKEDIARFLGVCKDFKESSKKCLAGVSGSSVANPYDQICPSQYQQHNVVPFVQSPQYYGQQPPYMPSPYYYSQQPPYMQQQGNSYDPQRRAFYSSSATQQQCQYYRHQ